MDYGYCYTCALNKNVISESPSQELGARRALMSDTKLFALDGLKSLTPGPMTLIIGDLHQSLNGPS